MTDTRLGIAVATLQPSSGSDICSPEYIAGILWLEVLIPDFRPDEPLFSNSASNIARSHTICVGGFSRLDLAHRAIKNVQFHAMYIVLLIHGRDGVKSKRSIENKNNEGDHSTVQ
ncbi:hypothetical protein AG1IA_02358 [Rhizoctonia solani AG-1 IA]|uniref:Uncharacterized protein n=1 Tax=Thanatephorus cucumeris (strain AG1-IA) TaxID=983506 RepID=L8X060_THACA|nr:hypothetical protein AG1IA_02358 [Rhizoctonia solani AG-1 IA]